MQPADCGVAVAALATSAEKADGTLFGELGAVFALLGALLLAWFTISSLWSWIDLQKSSDAMREAEARGEKPPLKVLFVLLGLMVGTCVRLAIDPEGTVTLAGLAMMIGLIWYVRQQR